MMIRTSTTVEEMSCHPHRSSIYNRVSNTAKFGWGKSILTYSGEDSSYESLFDDIFAYYKIMPKFYISSQFGSTIISLIKKGIEISILPQSYSHYYEIGVRFILLPFSSDFYFNWSKDGSIIIIIIIIKNIMNLI